MENFKFDHHTHPQNNRAFSPAISSVQCLKAERWSNLNESVSKNISKIFNENELKFIIDIHQGSEFDPSINYRPKLLCLRIMETDNLDELIYKWGVDIDLVYRKIMGLDNDATMTLIDWACNYCDYNNFDLD